MAHLLQSAIVIAPGSTYHMKKLDILINKGRIEKIGKNIDAGNAKIISSNNLHVSIGWFDIGAHCGEPGNEHRETLNSLNAAAMAGGYTGLAIIPDTTPTTQSKGDIQFVVRNTENLLVDFMPIAALTRNNEGSEITEMIDLQNAGAVAFSDGLESVQNGGVLGRAMEYKKRFQGKILHHPYNRNFNKDGQIHEGAVSISLGLPGISSLAEKSLVERDLNLSEYMDSDIILHCISAKESIGILHDAKKRSEKVSYTLPYLNLILEDKVLLEFDSNYKIFPPLRDSSDRKALLKAVNNDMADAIVSNHRPLEKELKHKEFPYADFGATGIQTIFSGLISIPRETLSLEKIISKIAYGPRRILALDIPEIKEDATANLTVFDPEVEWNYNAKSNQSKTENNPFYNTTLKGKVLAVFNNNKVKLIS
jgi:dihydroorotase